MQYRISVTYFYNIIPDVQENITRLLGGIIANCCNKAEFVCFADKRYNLAKVDSVILVRVDSVIPRW